MKPKELTRPELDKLIKDGDVRWLDMSQKPDPEMQKITQQFANAKNVFLRQKGQFDGNMNDGINAMLDQIFQTVIAPIYQDREKLKAQVTALEKEKKAVAVKLPETAKPE